MATKKRTVKKAPSKKKKRRKKGGRYKTGLHTSPKCLNEMKYRSGWELTTALHLDSDDSVVSYEYEPIAIEYVSNVRSGKIRKYYPDFLVRYKDGKVVLVEVKRVNQLNNITVLKKAKAAEQWCKKNKVKYEFWTDKMIQAFQKQQKFRELQKEK